MNEDYISYEDAQKGDRDQREELDALRKRVQKLTNELKNDGYVFKLEETSNEYLIKIGGRTTHILKAKELPWNSPGKTRMTMEEIIHETVIKTAPREEKRDREGT